MASCRAYRSLLRGITLLLASSALAQGNPTVKVLNGTYSGVYSAGFSQDQFLGIPFVQPPLGDLRLRNPQPLNTTWDGVRPATNYGPSCLGLNQSDGASEDCLNLNIVRPAGLTQDAGLAVAGALSSRSNNDALMLSSLDLRRRLYFWFELTTDIQPL
jgi:hypothetical protein